jgi:hypothetical protein
LLAIRLANLLEMQDLQSQPLAAYVQFHWPVGQDRPQGRKEMARSTRQVLLAVGMAALAIAILSRCTPLVKNLCPTVASAIWGS